jgi:hypothetical protein
LPVSRQNAYFAIFIQPMKKLFWIIPLAIILLLLAIVFFIPSQIVISEKVGIGTSQNGVVRLLTNKDRWQQWWPTERKDVIYDSANFSFQQEQAKMAYLQVAFGDTFLPVQMNTLFYQKDSTGVTFLVSLPPATNPVQKLGNYFKSRQLSNLADDLLLRLKKVAGKEENIYGLAIRQEKVKDSALVALKFESTGYPDTKHIYNAIEELRQYIRSNGATETAPPMLHANPEGKQTYQVMVAIPVSKPLEGAGNIEPKRMVLGNILVAEVKGGVYTAEKAIEVLSVYANDKKRISPAIPYQSLVTDRTQESDTSKWITRLFYPVI